MPDISASLEKRLSSAGPKRILALDGDGIRGLANIGITGLSDLKIANLMNLDLPENVDLLIGIGEKAGREYVKEAHLTQAFDLKAIAV